MGDDPPGLAGFELRLFVEKSANGRCTNLEPATAATRPAATTKPIRARSRKRMVIGIETISEPSSIRFRICWSRTTWGLGHTIR